MFTLTARLGYEVLEQLADYVFVVVIALAVQQFVVYSIAVGAGGPRVDTTEIRRMSERTNGEFHEARDAGAVTDVYRQIDALEKAGFQKPRYVFEDRFLPFLAAAVAILLLGRLLEHTVLGVFP